MAPKRRSSLDPGRLWPKEPRTPTAARDLETILASVVNLPMKYWRPGFFFFGAADERLGELSGGRFPAVMVPGKRHPVFCLQPLPDHIGFSVCPCSSKRPFDARRYRFISEGCRLKYTNHLMDRNSFLVEEIRINMPPDVGYRLRFRGEVPRKCIYVRPAPTDRARGGSPERHRQ